MYQISSELLDVDAQESPPGWQHCVLSHQYQEVGMALLHGKEN